MQIGEIIRADSTRDADFKDDTEYQSLLRLDATGTMGVLSIPAIGVELPIRHGTGADVLDDGLGHVHGTSLPVGGENTRTVVSGHTDALRIQPGRDLATLVTCTDTGNSRRLLVTGERYTPTPSETRETDSKTIRDGALACCGITFLAGLAVTRRDTERLCRHTDDAFRPKEHRS